MKQIIDELLKEYRQTTHPETMLQFLIEHGWDDFATETNSDKIEKAFKHCYHRYISDIIESVKQEINREIFK
jgi:hypothetical protein